MNTEDKKILTRKINSEIQKLIAYTANQDPGKSMHAPETDSNVKIEELVIQAVDQHTLAQARKKIAALRKTLVSIDDQKFGLCANCGTHISLERLMIVPDTDKCPKCAS